MRNRHDIMEDRGTPPSGIRRRREIIENVVIVKAKTVFLHRQLFGARNIF